MRSYKSYLLFLFIFSFAIRSLVFICYLSENKNYWQVDSELYHDQAVKISQGEGLKNITGKSDFYRLPGYPIFLSVGYKLFGTDTKKVLWLQIFLASFIPLLIFFLSLVLFPNKIILAKIASFYSSIHLGFVLYSGFYMTESLFILLFLLFSIFYFRNIQSSKNIFLAGLFLGLASLVRPVGQYFIILAILILLFFLKDKFRVKIKKSFYLFIGWLIPVLPLLLRNFLLLGQLFFHTLPGGHFLYLSAARVAMHVQDCSYWQARDNLTKELASLLIKGKEKKLNRKLNEIECCNVAQGLAVKYFKKHPSLAIKNWLTDILRTSLSLYSAELVYLHNNRQEINYFKKRRSIFSMFERYLFPKIDNLFLKIIIWLEILFFIFILLGFFSGIIICFKKNYLIYFKLFPFMALFIVLSLAGGYSRMRLPIEPFLFIFAFDFWISFFKKRLKVFGNESFRKYKTIKIFFIIFIINFWTNILSRGKF